MKGGVSTRTPPPRTTRETKDRSERTGGGVAGPDRKERGREREGETGTDDGMKAVGPFGRAAGGRRSESRCLRRKRRRRRGTKREYFTWGEVCYHTTIARTHASCAKTTKPACSHATKNIAFTGHPHPQPPKGPRPLQIKKNPKTWFKKTNQDDRDCAPFLSFPHWLPCLFLLARERGWRSGGLGRGSPQRVSGWGVKGKQFVSLRHEMACVFVVALCCPRVWATCGAGHLGEAGRDVYATSHLVLTIPNPTSKNNTSAR